MADGRATRWAWSGTAALALTSLVARILHRGAYTPGWDVLGAAQGLFLVSARSPREILGWYVANHWSLGIGWNLYGVTSVLIPGTLAAICPWEFWNHVVTFALTVVVLGLVAAAFDLGWRGAWIVVLAWLASPALVSQSVAGLPCVSAALPHALAAYVVLRLREHWVRSAVLCALIYLLAWQGQELGRTVWLLLIAAAVTVPGPWPARVVWIIAGGWIAADSFWHPTYNTALFAGLGAPDASQVARAVVAIGERLFVRLTIDAPVLFTAGIVSAILVRRERWLWRMVLLAELALVVVLALRRGPDGVWGRRFLLVDFYCLMTIVALFTELGARSDRFRRVGLILVLALAAVWQAWDALRFQYPAYRPSRSDLVFTLPFVNTNVDYFVRPADVDWAGELLAQARAGKMVLLAYNHSSYLEDPTNPAGVLERLYLNLGHRRFVDRVVVFGDERRWIDMPIRPMRDLDVFVDHLSDPTRVVGYLVLDPMDAGATPRARQYMSEMMRLVQALQRRFTISWDETRLVGRSRILRFSLRPLQS